MKNLRLLLVLPFFVVFIVNSTVTQVGIAIAGGGVIAHQRQQDEPVETETTEEDLFPTPEPPYGWYPYDPWPGQVENPWPSYPNDSTIFSSAPLPNGCLTKVSDPPGITLRLTGIVVGSLSFNDRQRGNSKPGTNPAVNNGNCQLGGFRKQPGGPPSRTGYKYQVEITWEGPMKDALWGQMASDMLPPYGPDPNNPGIKPDITFHNDTPRNDWVDKKWNLKPGESKSDYPVVEVVGQTLRYIDAPQGPLIGGGVKVMLIYAGACGIVTHRKILLLYYPPSFLNPMAFEIPESVFLREANSINFK